MLASFLCVFGSSIVHGYTSGVLNAPEFVSDSIWARKLTETNFTERFYTIPARTGPCRRIWFKNRLIRQQHDVNAILTSFCVFWRL